MVYTIKCIYFAPMKENKKENKKLFAFRFRPSEVEMWKQQAKKKSKNLTKFIESKLNQD